MKEPVAPTLCHMSPGYLASIAVVVVTAMVSVDCRAQGGGDTAVAVLELLRLMPPTACKASMRTDELTRSALEGA